MINASIRADSSISRALSNKLTQQLAQSTQARVIERNLDENIPLLNESLVTANNLPPEERTAEQQVTAKLADTLIAELQAADTIVIGTPVYNFGPPAVLKAWADLVARAGTTFRYTSDGPQGLLSGKKAYIVAVSGGTPIGSEIDFMSGWLRFFLGFIGISDVTLITADGIMGNDGEAKIEQANNQIKLIA